MDRPFICAQCAARQAGAGNCRGCGRDVALDLRQRRTRELLWEIDERLSRRREDRLRAACVAGAIALVVAAWMVPAYVDLRRQIFALPLLVDQIAVMVAVAWAAMALLEPALVTGRRRFPHLTDPFLDEPPA